MNCPCQSGQPFESCCQPIIQGAPAPTAEKLMRARYSAYATGAIDFIVATHDPKLQDDVDREATQTWSRESEWTGLEIKATERGGPDDDEGVVEFIARYRLKKQDLFHHERSRFQKIDGRWYYMEGHTPKPPQVVREGAKVGRNDPCPCGSGKKYKRCHGA
jgi:SEC-C motif-containing protein